MHLVIWGVGEVLCLIGVVWYEFLRNFFFCFKRDLIFSSWKPLSFKFPIWLKFSPFKIRIANALTFEKDFLEIGPTFKLFSLKRDIGCKLDTVLSTVNNIWKLFWEINGKVNILNLMNTLFDSENKIRLFKVSLNFVFVFLLVIFPNNFQFYFLIFLYFYFR